MTRKRKTKGDSEVERKKQAESELVESGILERVWKGPMQLQNRITCTKESETALLNQCRQANPNLFGYIDCLTNLWNLCYPDLRTSSIAISQRPYVLKTKSLIEEGLTVDEPMETEEIVVSNYVIWEI